MFIVYSAYNNNYAEMLVTMVEIKKNILLKILIIKKICLHCLKICFNLL